MKYGGSINPAPGGGEVFTPAAPPIQKCAMDMGPPNTDGAGATPAAPPIQKWAIERGPPNAPGAGATPAAPPSQKWAMEMTAPSGSSPKTIFPSAVSPVVVDASRNTGSPPSVRSAVDPKTMDDDLPVRAVMQTPCYVEGASPVIGTAAAFVVSVSVHASVVSSI